MTLQQIVEAALFQVTDNVLKHEIQRSGFSKDDECYRLDFREAEASILAAVQAEIEKAVAAERFRILRLIDANGSGVIPGSVPDEIRCGPGEAKS